MNKVAKSIDASDYVHAYFDAVLEAVNDAVTVIDTDGTVLCWNQAAVEIYGIPKTDIIGKKIGEFFPRGSLMLYQVIESGLPVRKVYHKPRPDKHVLISAVPVYDSERNLIGAVAVEQDITHLVQLSEGRYNHSTSVESALIPPVKEGSITVSQMVELASQAAKGKKSYSFLFVGESGVGRTTLAELVHNLSKRTGPFISIPCHQIPSGLLDVELFGYEGGVFGGQPEVRPGKLESAKGGTVYLMNIHTLPLTTQSKLVHAIRTSQIYRIGGSTPVSLDCQIIASTTPDIDSLVEQSLVAKDLYYLFHIATIPPLRERKHDLPELCKFFLKQAAEDSGRPIPHLSSEVLAAITAYDWPGNLLQLRNVMEHIVMVAKSGEVTLNDLPPTLRPSTLNDFQPSVVDLHALSEEVERATILDALKKANGNKAHAARLLGISRGSLYYKLRRYHLEETSRLG
jgi:PAS domain S-box-containing protein